MACSREADTLTSLPVRVECNRNLRYAGYFVAVAAVGVGGAPEMF